MDVIVAAAQILETVKILPQIKMCRFAYAMIG